MSEPIKIEMFPFGETFTEYMAEIRAEKKRNYEPVEYNTNYNGNRDGTGTRMKWDRHEFGMTPLRGEGSWEELGEKAWPEESPTTLAAFKAWAEELAGNFLADIDRAIKYTECGDWSNYLAPAHAWYNLGAGYENFYKCEYAGRLKVADTFPGSIWLGGDFARITLVCERRIEALKKLVKLGGEITEAHAEEKLAGSESGEATKACREAKTEADAADKKRTAAKKAVADAERALVEAEGRVGMTHANREVREAEAEAAKEKHEAAKAKAEASERAIMAKGKESMRLHGGGGSSLWKNRHRKEEEK